jgi:hypothetical protein
MYFKYTSMNIKSFLQYRSSIFMTIGAQVFGAGITLLGMCMLFERFGRSRVGVSAKSLCAMPVCIFVMR